MNGGGRDVANELPQIISCEKRRARPMKLTTLKPRVGTLNTQRAPILTTATQRITGSRLQVIRDRILRRDKGLCQCDDCKALPFPLAADIVDHRIPLWEGGPDTDENRQAMASVPCHVKKSAEEAKRRASGGR